MYLININLEMDVRLHDSVFDESIVADNDIGLCRQ